MYVSENSIKIKLLLKTPLVKQIFYFFSLAAKTCSSTLICQMDCNMVTLEGILLAFYALMFRDLLACEKAGIVAPICYNESTLCF